MLHACFRYEKEAKIDTISISRGSYRIRTQVFFFRSCAHSSCGSASLLATSFRSKNISHILVVSQLDMLRYEKRQEYKVGRLIFGRKKEASGKYHAHMDRDCWVPLLLMVTGEYQDVNVTYAPWADERGAAAVHACEGTHAWPLSDEGSTLVT